MKDRAFAQRISSRARGRLILPTPDAERLIELGWAEFHNIVTRGLAPPVVVMVYGPRDEHEFAVVKQVVELAYLAAGGAEYATDGHAIGTTASARWSRTAAHAPAAHPGWHDACRTPHCHQRTE